MTLFVQIQKNKQSRKIFTIQELELEYYSFIIVISPDQSKPFCVYFTKFL